MMKKIYAIALACFLSMGSAMAQVEFAWGVSADVVSSYLWRGQYLGGLSFQPEVSVGFEAEHLSLSVGAWGNVGASDWKFSKNNADPANNTYLVPELDLFLDFGFYGFHLGATHYFYFDGSPFFNGFKNPNGTSQTEVSLGYHFADEFDFGLYVDAYTMILGDDGEYEATNMMMLPTTPKYNRNFSTYIELGYEIELPLAFTLTPAIGLTPNKVSLYADDAWSSAAKVGFTNLSLRLDKAWELGDHTSISVFAMGCVNLYDINKSNIWFNESGENKINSGQKLNGCIGFNVSFE